MSSSLTVSAVTTHSSAGELSDGHGLEPGTSRAQSNVSPAFGFRVILSAFNMPDRVYLHPIDPELLPGAHNAIHILSAVETAGANHDHHRRIHPRHRRGLAIGGGACRVEYSLFVLEHHARRPLCVHAELILDDLALSQVSIFAAQSQPGELGARTEMTTVVNHHRIRHAHMVNINRQIMLEGMRADFCAVDELSQRLVEHARQADRITCKTPHGTEFQAELSPKLKWLKTSGIITRDKWGNLPGGEIFTSPMNTNGVFVVDGVVGDYLCERFGDLQSNPLTIEVEDNRIRALRSENKDLRDEFRAYTNTDENSNRVGEFAIGTNIACTHVIGHILQDEKIPGVPSRLVIPTPSTPAQTGLPRRTSTA